MYTIVITIMICLFKNERLVIFEYIKLDDIKCYVTVIIFSISVFFSTLLLGKIKLSGWFGEAGITGKVAMIDNSTPQGSIAFIKNIIP